MQSLHGDCVCRRVYSCRCWSVGYANHALNDCTLLCLQKLYYSLMQYGKDSTKIYACVLCIMQCPHARMGTVCVGVCTHAVAGQLGMLTMIVR